MHLTSAYFYKLVELCYLFTRILLNFLLVIYIITHMLYGVIVDASWERLIVPTKLKTKRLHSDSDVLQTDKIRTIYVCSGIQNAATAVNDAAVYSSWSQHTYCSFHWSSTLMDQVRIRRVHTDDCYVYCAQCYGCGLRADGPIRLLIESWYHCLTLNWLHMAIGWYL